MRKQSVISIRVHKDTKEAVEKAAQDDSRTMASYVDMVLIAHLKEKGYLKEKKG